MTNQKENLSASNTEASINHIPSQHVKNEHNPIPDNIQDTELLQNYARTRGESTNVETPHKNTGKNPNEIFIKELAALGHYKKPLLKVIRENCLDCCCHQSLEVRLCTSEDCSLWPYRMGTNPFRQTIPISEKQKTALKNGRASNE
ncbi:MAG: hypothetical protein JKY45_10095 [Emcibacter sp.]|nr:hypothetical protein [Emcibacter sp.]